ncbi:MAG: hypothetical protein U0271_22975 [Polyangiaceae bacterium]
MIRLDRRSVALFAMSGALAALTAAGCRQIIGVEDPVACTDVAECNPDSAPCSNTQCIDGECVYDPLPDGPGPDCGQCVGGQLEPYTDAGKDCYSGDPDTLGVGACKGGKWACDAGTPVCDGEITVTQETCVGAGKGVDEDCDGTTDVGGIGCECELGMDVVCYDGPANTRDVGICQAGTAMCESTPDGNIIGDCMGQVVPQSFDSCVTTDDEDCTGSSPACTCSHQFSVGFGGALFDNVKDIALAPDGTLVAFGQFTSNSITIGSSTIFRKGVDTNPDVFLARFDASGNPIEAKSFGGIGYDSPDTILATPDGFWITGQLGDTSVENFGSGASFTAVGADAFVVKLDSNLNLVSKRKIGGNDNDTSTAADLTPSGGIVTGGTFQGSIDVGGPANLASIGSFDAYLVQYDANGAYQWAKRFGTATSSETVYGAAVDPKSGNVAITGYANEAIDFGAGAVANTSYNTFVAIFDSQGTLLSARFFNATAFNGGAEIAYGPDGHIWVTGTMLSSLDVDGNPGTDLALVGTDPDMFVVELDALGAYVRGFIVDGQNVLSPSPGNIAVGPDGTVYVPFTFFGAVNVAGTPYTSVGNADGVFLKLTPSAQPVCIRQFGSIEGDFVSKARPDSNGNVFYVGNYRTVNVNLGGGTLPNAGENNGFIAKYRQ